MGMQVLEALAPLLRDREICPHCCFFLVENLIKSAELLLPEGEEYSVCHQQEGVLHTAEIEWKRRKHLEYNGTIF